MVNVSNPQSQVVAAFDMLKDSLRQDLEYIGPFLTASILANDAPMQNQYIKAMERIRSFITEVNLLQEEWPSIAEKLNALEPGTFKREGLITPSINGEVQITQEPFRNVPEENTPDERDRTTEEAKGESKPIRKVGRPINRSEFVDLGQAVRQAIAINGGRARLSIIKHHVSANNPKLLQFTDRSEVMRQVRESIGAWLEGRGQGSEWVISPIKGITNGTND